MAGSEERHLSTGTPRILEALVPYPKEVNGEKKVRMDKLTGSQTPF